MNPPEPILQVSGLTRRFQNRVSVQDLSFTMGAGDVLGLLGPNGAGKSTTMAMLATLLPPDAGRVRLCGLDLLSGSMEARRLLGYVPQELALYPTLSATDNLLFFGRVYGLRGKILRERVSEMLQVVGLQDRAAEPVAGFSGGMKRRLNLAAGLLHRPRLLLLDEPTVGVDPQSRNFLLEHVQQLKRAGVAVLYTTHYMEEAARLCDRVAILDQGRLLALDTPAGLLRLVGEGILLLKVTDPVAELPRFRALPGVRQASLAGEQVKLESDDARHTLLEVARLCDEKTCVVHSLQLLEPNLETVFLHLTGKALRD